MLMRMGKLDTAIKVLVYCQYWARHPQNDYAGMAALADVVLGDAYRLRGEHERAKNLGEKSREWSLQSGQREVECRANLLLARVRMTQNDLLGAREYIDPLLGSLDDERQKNLTRFAGLLLVGTRGTIHTTGHNATFRLLPDDRFEGVDRQRPVTVEPSRGHERDWLLACRGGKPAWANFDYASALNEFLMLGNVATQFDQKLEFDPIAMRITNSSEADAFLRSDYREGWSL